MVDGDRAAGHGLSVLEVLLVPAAFAIGSVPFGVLVARRRGVDIRERGSGNIGATNVARVIGVVPGLAVLLLDAAKGAVPVWLAHAHAGSGWTVAAVGLAAVLGHCFSPWLHWKGGKGVATALGVWLVIAPKVALAGMLAFAIAFAMFRVVALGSLTAALTIALILVVAGPPSHAALGVATAVLLVYTHRSNLRGLRERLDRTRTPDP